MVSMIVAMDRRRGIGAGNRLPWRLPADMKRFRDLTMGHHLIVGRKTWESIGRPLPGREIIVVTRNPGYRAGGCLAVHSLEEALNAARTKGESEAFIGGGAEIYREAMKIADRIYLTLVDTEVEADAFFPELNRAEWSIAEIAIRAPDDKNPFPLTFQIIERENTEQTE
ncbi:MAG: dihydrofolate reductase [Acidobacteria bacterium]|nr:dihydrofolate reductase [Acidobacteriota bacterium]